MGATERTPGAPNVYARRQRKLSEAEVLELKAAAVRLFAQKMPRVKIAAMLDLLPSTIHAWIPQCHWLDQSDVSKSLSNCQPTQEEIATEVLRAVRIVTQRRCFGSNETKKEFASWILPGTWRRARKYTPGSKTLKQFCYISAYFAATDLWVKTRGKHDAMDARPVTIPGRVSSKLDSPLEAAMRAEEALKGPPPNTLDFFASRTRVTPQTVKRRLNKLVERGLILRVGEEYRITHKGNRFLDSGRPQIGA